MKSRGKGLGGCRVAGQCLADGVERLGVLGAGEVSGVLAGGYGSDGSAEDLGGAGLGESVYEDEAAGLEGLAQFRRHQVSEVLDGAGVGVGFGGGDAEAPDGLALYIVGDSDDGGFGDGGMGDQD